jgi:protein SCO1/2
VKKIFVILILILAFMKVNGQEDKKSQVGIDEKLGQTIPMNLTLIDEYGKPVKLSDLTKGKPFALTLVYYRCPGLCSPLLTGFTKTVDLTDLIPGKDYQIITVSFDPTETYLTGAKRRKTTSPS